MVFYILFQKTILRPPTGFRSIPTAHSTYTYTPNKLVVCWSPADNFEYKSGKFAPDCWIKLALEVTKRGKLTLPKMSIAMHNHYMDSPIVAYRDGCRKHK